MTSSDMQNVNLAALMRTMAKAAVEEAVNKTRTTRQLSGTIEDLNPEELDVAWVRMDGEAMASDPTQSDNWGEPGVIPTTRLGDSYTGEQVRTTFDGSAGATSVRTSALQEIVVPFGAESGERIRINGTSEGGYIAFFNDDGQLSAFMNPQEWDIGDLTTPGRRITIDPLGGIRIRSDTDVLTAILDDLGYTLREPSTGLVTAEIQRGSFRLVDPAGTDDIEMVTTSQGTLPNPAYKSSPATSPGSTISVPAFPVFTTTPADDLEIAHGAAWLRATNQSATMTPPSGHTERLDENNGHASGTLQTSLATKQPADGGADSFTSTQSNWQLAIGSHVVVKGGGASSPSYRASSSTTLVTTKSVDVLSVTKPTGTAQNDALFAFVSLGVSGGGIPTGWTTPPGFVFLGANFVTTGSGASQSTVAVGVWVKLAGASEPSSYSTTINLPTGTKTLNMEMVAIQNPFLVPGGVQIRLAGRPIRRLLAYNLLSADSSTLCDFQNIPQGYDNLELVFDGTSTGGGSSTRLFTRFNNDSGANYFWKVTQGGSSTGGFAVNEIRHGIASSVASSRITGSLHIYGYSVMTNPAVLGRHYHSEALDVIDESSVGQWNNSGTAINRLNVAVVGAPASPKFKAGSKAFLYGY